MPKQILDHFIVIDTIDMYYAKQEKSQHHVLRSSNETGPLFL